MIIFGLGIWFWVLVLAEFCFLTWFVESEWGIASLVSIALFVVGIWWLADIPVWTWMKNNPGQLALYCIYYIVAGLVWSVFKYYFVLKRVQRFIKSCKKEWERNKGEFPVEIKDFKDYVASQKCTWNYKTDTDFERSTKRLVFWSAFWPTSMVWTVLNDPIRRLFKFLIYDVFIGIYRAMHKYMVERLLTEE